MSGEATRRMIAAQPQALRDVAALDIGEAVECLRACERFVLVGTGTSFHAAELGAQTFNRYGQHRARAVEAAWFARHEALRDDEAAILITHTGETAYTLAAREQLLAARAPFVSIVGPAVDWPEAVRTPVKEEAETYTVSYTAALAVLARLAEELFVEGPDHGALAQLADRVQRIVSEPGIDHVAMPARSLALVGAGPWGVTAREAALKLREGARMLCEGFDAERLLHGFAVPYGPADGLVLIQPAGDPDGLVAALGEAASREGVPVCEITDPDDITADHAPSGALLAQIAMTVRVQCLATHFARLRGTDPDLAITGAWAEPGIWGIGAP